MEDQEPYDEGHAVGGEVETLREQHLLRAVQPQNPDLVAGQLAGAGQRDAHADRDGHERQGLLEQMRHSPALPGPSADHVAHHGARQPSGRPGLPGRDVEQLADQVGQLSRAESEHSGGREPDQPPASLGAQPAPQRPGQHAPQAVGGRTRNRCWRGAMGHDVLGSLTRGSVSHRIQYENSRRRGHEEFSATSQRRSRRTSPDPGPVPAGPRSLSSRPAAAPGGPGTLPAGRLPAFDRLARQADGIYLR
jgi:hypothetical protein